jgi:pimeloyl-ACP methyl ester carboxylesterase
MLERKSYRLLCSIVLFWATAVPAQQVPSAVSSDPPPDKDFPASMDAPDVPSHGARLNAVFYLASGRGPHPTVLLMHGLPGNEKNLDLAYAIRRAGWNVLLPHYRGSWGSTGTFSFANAIEDTQAAIRFLREAQNVKKYRIDLKKIVLIGHSMGGFMVSYAAAHDPEVAGLVMISALNIGNAHPPVTERTESLLAASPRLAGTTPEGLLAEEKENAPKWNYLDYVEALKTRPVLILESHDRNLSDNKAMTEALKKTGNSRVTEMYLDTDHTYSDHRIALQIAVLQWLETVLAPAAK